MVRQSAVIRKSLTEAIGKNGATKKEIAGELQTEFSQKAFHEAVLTVGPAPFDIVNEFVRQKLLPDN